MPDRASCALLTDDTEVTPWTPRTFLGISRIHVIRLVHNRKLPAHLVGTHRRLRAVDVLAYKTRRDVKDASRSACESQHLHLRSSRAGLLHARDRAGAAGPWCLGPVTGDSRLGYADLSSRSPSDFACGVKTML